MKGFLGYMGIPFDVKAPKTLPDIDQIVEKDANIKAVPELLGHANLGTTQVYLSVTADHLEEAIGLLD